MTDSLSLSFNFVVVSILNLSDTLYKLTYMIIATFVVNFIILILDF